MSASAPDRSALSREAQKLLEVLLEVSDIGRAQVASSRLRKATGLNEGGLIRARIELTQNDLLRTEPGLSANGLRGANIYVLNMPVLDPPEEKVSEPEPEPLTAPPLEEVLEGPEGDPEPSVPHRSKRRGFLGLFRRGDKTS